MAQSAKSPDLVEEAESMRGQGRLPEALEVAERFLRKNPAHPRALLLRSRVLYQLGRKAQALQSLHDLGRVIGDDRVQPIVTAFEGLGGGARSLSAPAFVTESMARLLTQQGYLLEALEIYRRLIETGPEQQDWHDEIARLKMIVEQEGSRGATAERAARELEACELWLKQRQRGS